ncbi:hypothetical protein ACTOB_004748 [Actinoplanes oblitus]|uniref:Arsenate reductase n=1 Tax=Actinoplanes oblitus TaxID=3040509 RepID=A0ABY8W6Y8_9ACTN|nr:hypothetical protein [Actinoplanes oblitus]WIM92793.1 hypothetical protein ACTOB_004748 [Actinoplanes oblitus]
MTATEPLWVPDACTLPTAEQPFRLAEVDRLFATAVRGIDMTGPTRVRLRLAGPDGLAETVRDLTARESACCSFFGFTVTAEPAVAGESVTLEVQVPRQHTAVLDALVRRAVTAAAAGSRDTSPRATA